MKSFAVKHKNLNVRLASRSGGCFTAISDYVLEKEGIVYGCQLDDNLQAIHNRATNKDERNNFRGSKYVQSDKKDVFRQVKTDLMSGLWVLFSGTTCEVVGLKSFLGNSSYSKLILADILCHGVPSPLLWKKYKEFCEAKIGSPIETVDFRDKQKYGWSSHLETLRFQDGKVYSAKDYACIFYSHYGLRLSCYHCPYKSIDHPSDFTLADCWGIDQHMKEFNDNKGISLLLVNSDKAMSLLNEIKSCLDCIEVNIEDYMQLPFRVACHVNNRKRKRFWKELKHMPFAYIVKKYGENSNEEKTKKLINKFLPIQLKNILKKILGR